MGLYIRIPSERRNAFWRHPSYLRGSSRFHAMYMGANSGNFKPIGRLLYCEPITENSGRACEGDSRRIYWGRPYFTPGRCARIRESLNRSSAVRILNPIALYAGGEWGGDRRT